MKDADAKINAASVPKPAEGDAKAPTPPFDIAKFAGIFAAIGVAVGMIGSALAAFLGLFEGFKWYQYIAVFIGIMIFISGPAMVLAWMKLRRRNIAPLLNANGWAINASSKINILFGETLTDIARYPKLKLKDPYAKSGMPAWAKWLVSLVAVAVVATGMWLGNVFAACGCESPLACFNKAEVVAVDEAAEAPAETEAPAVAAEPAGE
jgi:hypothetical protein